MNRYPKTALDTDSHPSRQLFRNGNERLEAFCRPLTLRGKSEFLQRLRISHEVIRGLAVQPDEEILDGGEDICCNKRAGTKVLHIRPFVDRYGFAESKLPAVGAARQLVWQTQPGQGAGRIEAKPATFPLLQVSKCG